MRVLIRPAIRADVQKVYDFICDLEKQIFNFEVFKNIFFENIQLPDRHYLIAHNDKQILGYASMHAQLLLHHCGKVGEIEEMYVLPTQRNLGIGQQFLTEFVAIATRDKYVLLEVTSNQKRLDTHQFYQKNGFIHTHAKFVKEF